MPIVFAILSYLLYASQAVVLEQKLSAYSTPAILVMLYVVMFPMALLVGLLPMKLGGQQITWPSGQMLWWVAGAAVVFFFADAFMVMAYTSARKQGAEYLFAIVAVGALYPVLAAAIKYVWTQRMPNAWHVAAFAAAAVVLLLAAKGNRVEERRKAAATPSAPVTETHP